MSYQVLARKWRPHSFQDMVGQEHILRMLCNALNQNRIHHAYLFTGTRGTGKTTLARILAKSLNCEVGISANPCGNCNACTAIDSGSFIDLYEVDAASRTKVEDTRELLENVQYPPSQGRYKIYLIDEVHMLSNHSFNALLKTLEEPPSHVKFLLATTDPKKLPITILSRCLQFPLKRITQEDITGRLNYICDQENISCEVAGLELIAKAADGSLRDALSLLDQAVAYGNGEVKKDDVMLLLGCMTQDQILPLVRAIAAKNHDQLFQLIASLSDLAPDFAQALNEIITIFHKIALMQIVPNSLPADATLQQLATHFTAEEVQLYYQIALVGRRDLNLSPSPQLGFEMTLLRMIAFQPGTAANINIPNDGAKIAAKETMTTMAPIVSQAKTNEASLAPVSPPAIAVATTPTVSAPQIIAVSENAPEWKDIVPKLELTGMAFALAANCTLTAKDDKKMQLSLSANHQPMLNSKLKERLNDAINRYFSQTLELSFEITSEDILTPVKHQQNEEDLKLANAKTSAMNNPLIKKIVEMFDGSVEVSLAKN